MPNLGKILIVIGVVLVVVGIVIWLWGDKLSWIGNLPGDIKIKKENFSLYIPITTMILASALLTLILWLIRKFFQ